MSLTAQLGPYFYQTNTYLARNKHVTVYEGGRSYGEASLAIKQIFMRADWMTEEFAFREVEVLKELQEHPHIVKYVQHFVQPDFMYIVTELCRKDNLHHRIRKQQSLSEEEALEWMSHLVAGYEHIRSKGFIHRDLKPENMLIDYQNRLKIADFGYSIRINGEFFEGRYNVGTPLYMAPEVLRHNLYSEKGDIWSMGVILYEMVHGVEPFKAKNQAELLMMIKQPIKVMKCSTATALLIQQCLRLNPPHRPDLRILKKSIACALEEKVKERQAVKNAQARSLVENQLDYVEFLAYVVKLAQRVLNSESKQLLDEVTWRQLHFVLRHTIKVRLSLIKELLESSQAEIRVGQQERLQEFRRSYSENQGEELSREGRLKFFKSRGERYHQQEHWHSQAVFKQVVQALWRKLGHLSSEQQVALRQDELRLIDFLLSTLSLNALLIQNHNNLKEFSKCSHLSDILSHPSRFSLSIYLDMTRKIRDLKIVEPNPNLK